MQIGEKGSYNCQCFPGYSLNTNGTCADRKVDCEGKWAALSVCNNLCQQQEVFKITRPAEGSGASCPAAEGDQRSTRCNGGNCKSCMSRDCNGRGRCSEASGVCTCDAGWTGPNCEQSTSVCAVTLCSGHGNCNELNTACTCNNGFKSRPGATEKFCDIDPCAGCPADRCNRETGVCACPDDETAAQWPACTGSDCEGYWGPWAACGASCEQKRYFTISRPAYNGGQKCSNKAGDFESRACKSGVCCNLKEGDCQNGGAFQALTCECMCKPGFQGDVCEKTSTTANAVITTVSEIDRNLFNTTTAAPVDFSPQMAAAEAVTTPAPAASDNKLFIYIGAGAGGLLLLGGLAWFFMRKKPAAPATDPLLAGMEGLEGMDLSGMDLSALGMDPAAMNANPM